MHEFETFVYLDLQKTGSTFIVKLLRKFCSQKELRTKLHLGVGKHYDAKKFHFISVRDPVDLYFSLYSYGCDKHQGSVFKKLNEMGNGDLYDNTWQGFERWLDVVLAPQTRCLLVSDNEEYNSDLVGLFSFRYLQLAIVDYAAALNGCSDRTGVLEAYHRKGIVQFVIRNETFTDDLTTLVTDKLRDAFPKPKKALAFIESARRINASPRIDSDGRRLSDKQREALRGCEWFLAETFGY